MPYFFETPYESEIYSGESSDFDATFRGPNSNRGMVSFKDRHVPDGVGACRWFLLVLASGFAAIAREQSSGLSRDLRRYQTRGSSYLPRRSSQHEHEVYDGWHGVPGYPRGRWVLVIFRTGNIFSVCAAKRFS